LAGSHVNAGAVVRRKRKQRAVSSVTQDTVIEPLTPDSQTSLLSGIKTLIYVLIYTKIAVMSSFALFFFIYNYVA
jgi:hypothetical protein